MVALKTKLGALRSLSFCANSRQFSLCQTQRKRRPTNPRIMVFAPPGCKSRSCLLLPVRPSVYSASAAAAAANVIEIKCFILRGRPRRRRRRRSPTANSLLRCAYLYGFARAKPPCSRNLSEVDFDLWARWRRPGARPFAQMDGYKRRSQERSQSVRRSKEGGREGAMQKGSL